MRLRVRGVAAGAVVAVLATLAGAAWRVPAYAADAQPRRAPGLVRGGGESQIDESAPDESATAGGGRGAPASLPERLRAYVEGSLARYDTLKRESAGFRRQGWYPSLFLRDPERDLLVEPASGGASTVTVHISYARRDLEQRLVIGPAEQFALPEADKRFLAEVLGALATADPQVARARLRFWFAVLRVDGQMMWESRGGIGLGAAAASRFPAGSRTAEAVWPLLDENTIPPSVWGGR